MYRFTRRATIAGGAHVPQAMQFSQELTGYMNKTYGIQLKTGMEMFGRLQMHWQADFPSLEDIESLNTKMVQDKAYWAMVTKGKEYWVPGSLKDTVINFPT